MTDSRPIAGEDQRTRAAKERMRETFIRHQGMSHDAADRKAREVARRWERENTGDRRDGR